MDKINKAVEEFRRCDKEHKASKNSASLFKLVKASNTLNRVLYAYRNEVMKEGCKDTKVVKRKVQIRERLKSVSWTDDVKEEEKEEDNFIIVETQEEEPPPPPQLRRQDNIRSRQKKKKRSRK